MLASSEGGSGDLTGGNTDLGLECGRTQLLVITFYHKYFFAVLEVHLEVCMLIPTRESIDTAMTYGREKRVKTRARDSKH